MTLLASLATVNASANNVEERLRRCDKAYVSCKTLVEAQDEVISDQSMVIVTQQEQIKVLEEKNKWYNSPIFWSVIGGVLGVAGGIAIGVSR